MNFYEFYDPYYALIMAKDEEEATKQYIEKVAGYEDEFDDILKNCELVNDYYAVAKFSRSYGEDRTVIHFDEIMQTLSSSESNVLLIDGHLI